MRDKTSSAAGQLQHQQHSNHQNHHNRHHPHHPNSSGPTPPAAANVMASDLSEQRIFSPGALVQVTTITSETVVGEVLAFEYDNKLLILKQSTNGVATPYNVTGLNLALCSKVEILAEPDAERIATEMANTTLPDIDIQKLNARLFSALDERKFIVEAFKTGAGIDGVSLYSRLQKTVGDHFGVTWDADSIIIGKNIQIAKPYGADCISVRNVGANSLKHGSLDYAKQLVEKYWRDQEKDPYTLQPLNGSAGNTNKTVAPAVQQQAPPPQSKPMSQVVAAAVSQAPAPQQQQQQQPPSAPQTAAQAVAGHGHGHGSSAGQSPKGGRGSGGGGGGVDGHTRGSNRKSSPLIANQPHHHSKQQQQQQNNHHHEPLPHPPPPQQQPPQRTKAPSYAALLAKPDSESKTNSGAPGTASSGPPSAVRG